MIRLLSLTHDAEDQILFCARVSSDQSNTKTGLIKYLIDHEHWSPFEMAHAVFEITTSRAIAAQILRHRSFSFQEFSQRYAKATEYIMYGARERGASNRQSSLDTLDEETIEWWMSKQEDISEYAQSVYNEAIDKGIATECARMVLPLNTKTKLYMSGTIRSWIHYCNLRTKEDVQLEHRELASMIKHELTRKLPNTAEALGWTHESY